MVKTEAANKGYLVEPGCSCGLWEWICRFLCPAASLTVTSKDYVEDQRQKGVFVQRSTDGATFNLRRYH